MPQALEDVAHRSRPARAGLTNAFTVDVEDYFQVSALAPQIDRSTWDERPCRVERNVGRLLELLAGNGVHGTFFTLGWIAKRYPRLIRDIVEGGHELASHGFGHLRASEQSVSEFRQDVRDAKLLLEDIAAKPVLGYRAPSFSIGHTDSWAFDVLVEEGYRYSSSVYPVQHDHYGSPDAPRFRYAPRKGLLEIPIATATLLGRNFPAGGGGYFRLLPYAVSRWALHRVNTVDGQPAIFYMHPWELDPDQPRIPGASMRARFRHYVNLHRTDARLARLLGEFRWDRVDRVFGVAEGEP